MAQCIKCSQQASVFEQAAPSSVDPVAVPQEERAAATYRQPSMQRHIHPIPIQNSTDIHHSSQQSALLQALERQNALMTDLLAAVNGLAALICSRNPS